MMLKKHPLYKKVLTLIDLITITVAIIITLLWTGYHNLKHGYTDTPYVGKFIFLFVLSLGYLYIFSLNYLYKLNIITTKNKQLILLTKSFLQSLPLFIVIAFILEGRLILRVHFTLAVYFVIVFVLLATVRIIIISKIYKKLRAKGYLRKNILIVGAGEAGQMLAAQIESDTDFGIDIVGFIDDDPKKLGVTIFNKPVLGRVSDITAELLTQHNIKSVFIAINFISYPRLLEIIKYCGKFDLQVSLVNQHFTVIEEKLNISQFDGVSNAIFNSFGGATVFYGVSKKIFDVVVSSALIALLLPLFLVISLLIKLTSSGPIFYKPVMISKGGKKFTMYKFRSMFHNSDDTKHRKLVTEIIRNSKKNGEKLKNDARITWIGRALRRYSLDELPQLFNVLRGEMSLVGPRPCLPYELELYEKWHKLRLSVNPGITGLWQVYGRNKVSFNDMVIMDIYYIRNRSLLLDYSIILRSIPVALFGIEGV